MMFSCSSRTDKDIMKAINYQIRTYPESRLQDIYKNFFQDFYGPGHLVSDPESAVNYLREELKEVQGGSLKSLVEPVGYRNNFVRVDLSVLVNEVIGFNAFTEAFLKSAEYFKEPDPEEWKLEWERIFSVLISGDFNIPDLQEDTRMIQDMMSRGEYVLHHSKAYVDAYQPHYRIIYREIFDRELLSFFQ